jgi:hypothetical protein
MQASRPSRWAAASSPWAASSSCCVATLGVAEGTCAKRPTKKHLRQEFQSAAPAPRIHTRSSQKHLNRRTLSVFHCIKDHSLCSCLKHHSPHSRGTTTRLVSLPCLNDPSSAGASSCVSACSMTALVTGTPPRLVSLPLHQKSLALTTKSSALFGSVIVTASTAAGC